MFRRPRSIYKLPAYFGNIKKLINNSSNANPNTPKPKTKKSMAIPNLLALGSSLKFQTVKPKEIIRPVRRIFTAYEASFASDIIFSLYP